MKSLNFLQITIRIDAMVVSFRKNIEIIFLYILND